jgi:hypothetical protein
MQSAGVHREQCFEFFFLGYREGYMEEEWCEGIVSWRGDYEC